MSDSQRQVKKSTELALTNLVEHAKRMQLSSVSVNAAKMERLNQLLVVDSIEAGGTLKKIKTSPNIGAAGGGGALTQRPSTPAARKLRKLESDPSPPPPPSPRDGCKIGELRDEYNQIDKLLDKMLLEATSLNQELLLFSKYQLDFDMVQEMELEATTRALNSLFSALTTESESNELKKIIKRCNSALERSKERVQLELLQPSNEIAVESLLTPMKEHGCDLASPSLNRKPLEDMPMTPTEMITK